MGGLECYPPGDSQKVINVEMERERMRISRGVANEVMKVCLREVSQTFPSSIKNTQRLRNECSICSFSHEE